MLLPRPNTGPSVLSKSVFQKASTSLGSSQMMLQLLDLLVTIMRPPVWGSQSENAARHGAFQAEDGRIMSVLLIQAEDSFHSSGRRGPRHGVCESHASTEGDITCFHSPQLCMLSTSSHMSLSIPPQISTAACVGFLCIK